MSEGQKTLPRLPLNFAFCCLFVAGALLAFTLMASDDRRIWFGFASAGFGIIGFAVIAMIQIRQRD